MINFNLESISTIIKISFIVIFVSYFYTGLTTPAIEGDSVAYHIPIAKSVLNLKILNPDFYLGYYPSNAEVILSLFLLSKLPLNIFNVLGWGILVFVLFKLAIAYRLNRDFAWVYSLSVSGLHVFTRWLNTQVIDIWLAIFYAASLYLFKNFNGTKNAYLSLGLFTGLAIGVKYSGPLFVGVLFLVNFKKIIKHISVLNAIIFLIPFLLFGLSWYIRNLVLVGNPIYPLKIFNLNGITNWNILDVQYWEVVVTYPLLVFNALFSEYMAWPLLILCSIIFKFKTDGNFFSENQDIKQLMIITFFNLIIFLFLPTNYNYDIIVSSLRYSYPVIITLSLFLLLDIKKKNFIKTFILIVLLNVLFIPMPTYNPKLILFILATIFLIISFKKYIYFKK